MRLRNLFLSAIFALTLALRASDKDAAAALMKDGIKVTFDGANAVSRLLFADKEMNKKPPTPEQFKLVGQLKKLKSLTVYNTCGATDATFDFIDGLDELDKVAINSLKISDDGFQHFAKLKNLKSLTLWHCFDKDKFNGSGSAYLADLPRPLRIVRLRRFDVQRRRLESVREIETEFPTLHLHHTMATDAGFVHLKAHGEFKSAPMLEHAIFPRASATKPRSNRSRKSRTSKNSRSTKRC